MKKVTASWTKVVQTIDKRTASEALKAETRGKVIYKVAMSLLKALAQRSRSTGSEDDLIAARLIDKAVTQLKVIVPTVSAIAAWGQANKACDQVKLFAHADPNTVCEAPAGRSSKVKAACRKCDAATAKMLQLAGGTPAGEHTIEELIETTVEDIDYVTATLEYPEFTSSSLAARRKASLTKPLGRLKAALQATLESSRAGEAAWSAYDDLRGRTFSQSLVETLEKLPKWTKAPRHAKALRAACKAPRHAKALRAACKDARQKRGEEATAELDVGTAKSPATSGASTWRDPKSGLTWQVTPTGGYMDWSTAKAHCAGLNLGDSMDWRLPTIGELRFLIRGCPATQSGGRCNIKKGDCLSWSCWDGSCRGCSNKGGPGKGCYWPGEMQGECSWYWSSSVSATDAIAWTVHFDNGSVFVTYSSNDRPVRCVR